MTLHLTVFGGRSFSTTHRFRGGVFDLQSAGFQGFEGSGSGRTSELGFAPTGSIPNHVKFAARAGDCCIFDIATCAPQPLLCLGLSPELVRLRVRREMPGICLCTLCSVLLLSAVCLSKLGLKGAPSWLRRAHGAAEHLGRVSRAFIAGIWVHSSKECQQ